MAVPLPKPPKPPSGIVDRGEALKSLLSGSYGVKKSSNPINYPRTDILSAAGQLPRTDPNSIDWDPFWRPIEQTLLTITAGGMGNVNVADKAVKYLTSTDPSKHMNYWSHLGPVGDFRRGFWASVTMDKNSDDFVYGSDLIENVSDNVGKRYDPNYVDRENNIDPKLKFGAGLAIDIFADPITYLPGGILASGVRGGVRAAQAATKLSKIPAGIKGVKTGLPEGVGDFKMGRFTKQLKPTGYDEWVAARSLNNIERIARKNQIPTEGLLALAGAKSAKSYEIAAAKLTKESPIGRVFTVDDVKNLQTQVQTLRAGNRFYPIKGNVEAAETLMEGVAKSPAAQKAARAATSRVGVGAAKYTTLKAGEEVDELRYQKLREESVRRTKAGFWAEARQEFKTDAAARQAAARAEESAQVRTPSSADPESFEEVVVNAGRQALLRFQPAEATTSPNQDVFTIVDAITDSPVGSTEAIARVSRELIRNGEQLDLTVTAPSGTKYSLSELMDGVIDGTATNINTADLEHVSRFLPRVFENMQEARKSVAPRETVAPKTEVGAEPVEDVLIDPLGVPKPVGSLKDIVDFAQIDAFADELEALARTEQALDAEILAVMRDTNVEGFVYDVNIKGLRPGNLEKALRKENITTVIDARAYPNADVKEDYLHLKGDRLELSLGEAGIKYVPSGAKLGDRPGNAAFYVDGNPTYETMRTSPEWIAGVDEIVAQVKAGETIAILSFGKTTRDTLTSRLLQPELNARGYQVRYVRADLNDADFRPEGYQPNSDRLRALYEKRGAVRAERERIYQQTIKADAQKLLPGAAESEINALNRRIISAEAHTMAGWRKHVKSPVRGLQQVDVGKWADNVAGIAEESAKRLAKDGGSSVEAQSVLLTKLLALHGGENVQELLDRLVLVSGGTQKATADLTDMGDAADFVEKVLGSSKPFGVLDVNNRFERGVSEQEIFDAVQALAALKSDIPGYTDKAREIMAREGVGPEDARIVDRSFPFVRQYQDAVEANPGERVNIWGEVVDEDFVAHEANRIIDNIANTYYAEAVRTPDVPTGQSIETFVETASARNVELSANDEGVNVIRDITYMQKTRVPVRDQKVTTPTRDPAQDALRNADYAITNSRLQPAEQPSLRRPQAASVADSAALQLSRPPVGNLNGKKVFVSYDENLVNGRGILEVVSSIKNTHWKGAEIFVPELPINMILVNHLRKEGIPFTVFRSDKATAQSGSSSKTTLMRLGEPSGSQKGKTIMLARNAELANRPLTEETKNKILKAHNDGAKFNVGDMPNVDSAYHQYLDEIGAKYTVYHMGGAPRAAGQGELRAVPGDARQGRGTAEGDAKDAQMRSDSSSSIVELADSSTTGQPFQFFEYGRFDKETRPVVATFDASKQGELKDVYDHIVGFARQPLPDVQTWVQTLYRMAGNSDPSWPAKTRARTILESIGLPYQAGTRGVPARDALREAIQNPEAKKAYLQYIKSFQALYDVDPATKQLVNFEARGAGVDIFGQMWRNRYDFAKTAKGEELLEANEAAIKNTFHPYAQYPDGDIIWQAVKESRVPVSERGQKGAEFTLSATGRKMYKSEKPKLINVLSKYLGAQRAYEVLPHVRYNEARLDLQALLRSSDGDADALYTVLEKNNLLNDILHRTSTYSHLPDAVRPQALTYASSSALTDLNRAYFSGDIETLAEYWGSTVARTEYSYSQVVQVPRYTDEFLQAAERKLADPNVIKKLFDKRIGSEITDVGTLTRPTAETIEVDFMRDPDVAKKLPVSKEYAVVNRIGEEGGALVRWTMTEDPQINSFINDISLMLNIEEEVARRIVPGVLEYAMAKGTTPDVFDSNVFVRYLLGELKVSQKKTTRPLTREETRLYNEGKLAGDIAREAKNKVDVALDLKRLLPVDETRTGLLGTAWKQYDQNFVDMVTDNLLGQRFENGQAVAEFLRSKNLTLRGAWDSQREAFIIEREFITDSAVHNADEVRRILAQSDADAQIERMLAENAQRVQNNLLRIKNESARNLVQNVAAGAYRRSVASLKKGEQYARRGNVWANITKGLESKIKPGTIQHWNASMLALTRWHDISLSTGVFPVTKLTNTPLRYVTVSAQQDWAYLSFVDVYRSITTRNPGMDEMFRTAIDAGFPINVIEEAAVFAMKMNRSEVELLSETKTMLLAEYMTQRLRVIDKDLAAKINPFEGNNFETAFIAQTASWLTDSQIAGELLQKHNMYAAAAFRTADEVSNAIVEPVRQRVVDVANNIARNSSAQHEALNESIDELRQVLRDRGYAKDSLESLLSLQKLSKFHVEHFTPLDINAARYRQRLTGAAIAGTDSLTSEAKRRATARQRRIAELYQQNKQIPKNIRQAQKAWLEKVQAAQNTERAALANETIDLAKQVTGEDVTSMAAAAIAAGDEALLAAAFEKTINIAENVESLAESLQRAFTQGPVMNGYYDLTAQMASQGKKGNYAEHIAAEQAREASGLPLESLREAVEATPASERLPGSAFERTSRTTRFMTAMSGRANMRFMKHMQVTEEAGMDAVRNMFERGVESTLKQAQQLLGGDKEAIDFGWQVIIGTFGPKNMRKPLEQLATTPEQMAIAQQIVHQTRTLFDTETAHTLAMTGLDTDHINSWLRRGPLRASAAQLPEGMTGYDIANTIPVMLNNLYDAYLNGVRGADYTTLLKGYNFALRNAAIAPNSAARMSAQFGHRGLGYSTVKEALADGLVQPQVGRGAGTLFQWLDPTQAYPKEILEQARQLEKFMNYDSQNVGKLLKAFDKPTTVIKSSLTLWKTGHHVVSAMGEAFMNVLAGVYNPYRYAQAFRALREGGEFRRGSIFGENILDLENWAKEYADEAVPNPTRQIMEQSGNKGIPIRIGNKTTVVPYQAFYREFMRRGLGISANVAEDLLVQSDEIVKSGGVLRKIFSPVLRANQGLAEFSARRDNLFRMAHAIDIIQKRSFSSSDDMFESLGIEITQWHPTMQSLSGFERKYMRRLVFFYTWMRNATNKIVEAIVENPMAFVLAPKINYAISGAMGGEPQSIGQTSPNDPRIADFYARQVLGPAWYDEAGNVVGITINAPQLDIMQSLIGGIQYDTNLPVWQQVPGSTETFLRENVIGTLNPIMKGMIEIPYGTEIRSYGPVPIEDRGEYITDLTGLGYISRGTGMAFINEQGFLQPRTDRDDSRISQIEKQNRSNLNALTGLRFAEYNKYFETAERQRQERNRSYLDDFVKNFGKTD